MNKVKRRLATSAFLLGLLTAFIIADPFSDFENKLGSIASIAQLSIVGSGAMLSVYIVLRGCGRVLFVFYPMAATAIGYLLVLIAREGLRQDAVALIFASFVWAELALKVWMVSGLLLIASIYFFPKARVAPDESES